MPQGLGVKIKDIFDYFFFFFLLLFFWYGIIQFELHVLFRVFVPVGSVPQSKSMTH